MPDWGSLEFAFRRDSEPRQNPKSGARRKVLVANSIDDAWALEFWDNVRIQPAEIVSPGHPNRLQACGEFPAGQAKAKPMPSGSKPPTAAKSSSWIRNAGLAARDLKP